MRPMPFYPPRASERLGQSVLRPVVLALLVLALTSLSAEALTFTFTTLDAPGASQTTLFRINNAGRIIGWYLDSSGTQHALVWEEGTFTTIDPPGAVSARALLINEAGQVVGTYKDTGGTTRPFLWDEGTFTPINVPGVLFQVVGISEAAQIAGTYKVGSVFHAFLWHEGTSTTIDPPGAVSALAAGINATGQVVGNYSSDSPCNGRGFLWDEGTFTTIEAIPCDRIENFTVVGGINSAGQIFGYHHDETQTFSAFRWEDGSAGSFSGEVGSATFPSAMNDSGQIVGTYENRFGLGTTHAFYWGTPTIIDPPDTVSDSFFAAAADDINAAGLIRGRYRDSTGTIRPFLLQDGIYTKIDFPGAASTEIFGMNDAGEIVGTYQDSSGTIHGFLGKPAVSVSGLTHLNSMTTSFNAKPVPGGPAGTFTIEASFSNASSTPIDGPQFVVTQLSNGNLLLSADLPPGTVGARLTPDVGSDGIFSPGESFDVQFVIGLQKRSTFTFRVGLLGVAGP